MGGGVGETVQTARPPSCLRPRSARAPFFVTHASPSPARASALPDGAAARGRLLSSLDAGVEACECTEAWARRVERAGAAGSEGGASRLWRRRSHFPLRPPLHFGRPCRRHVMCSPGPPLLSRLRSRGPCAWARGLSPIGGRRLRGGSLVIGRRRGGRGPGTLLVTPAPAWGG